MLRGINRQNIFEDDDDRYGFLKILATVKKTSGFKLLCYCLMDNHVHLLLLTGEEPLGQVLKRIAVRYALRFNAKYERNGHLFQDRYKSEPILQESYLLAAVRYICQNPLKARLCKAPQDYIWSSTQEYLKISNGCTDTEMVLSTFSHTIPAQVDAFAEFVQGITDESFLDYDSGRRKDSELKTLLHDMCDCDSASDFQTLDTVKRDIYLHRFKKDGFSMRQIARITGIPFGVVRRI